MPTSLLLELGSLRIRCMTFFELLPFLDAGGYLIMMCLHARCHSCIISSASASSCAIIGGGDFFLRALVAIDTYWLFIRR